MLRTGSGPHLPLTHSQPLRTLGCTENYFQFLKWALTSALGFDHTPPSIGNIPSLPAPTCTHPSSFNMASSATNALPTHMRTHIHTRTRIPRSLGYVPPCNPINTATVLGCLPRQAVCSLRAGTVSAGLILVPPWCLARNSFSLSIL